MRVKRPSPFAQYGIAVLFVALAIVSTLLVRLFFSLNPTPLLLIALVGAAWYGGRYPGLLAAILLDLSVDLLFDDTPYVFSNPSGHMGRLLVLGVISLLATSRRKAKEDLMIRERQQAAVARFGQEALSRMPMHDLLPKAAELVRATLGVDLTAICEISSDEQKLCYVAGSGFETDVKGFEFDHGAENSLAGHVLRTGDAVAIADMRNNSELTPSPLLEPYGIRSMAGVKLLRAGGPYGVLGAFDRSPREFSTDDVNFLQAVANIVAEAGERLRNEEAIAEQRTWLKTTLSSIGDGVIATDRDGNVIFMNPVAENMTGWTETEANGNPLEAVFNIISEDTREPVVNPVETVIETGMIVGLGNHTLLIAKDGTEMPIADSAAPIVEGDEVKGVVLVFSDMTERRLAEQTRRESETMHRLVEAQESERHRIARDLHDHLGQQMTALRLRVESLMEESADRPSLARSISEVQEAAVKIDRDIGFLSWELRPTELDQLGLENAIGSYVREWSNQHGIRAEFHADVPSVPDGHRRLPAAAETNLYRIVQEALNNVLKHAEASRVSVLLHQRKDALKLVIEDDGRGIDQESGNGDGPVTRGLGLTGMQERAAVMKGDLEIESRPGEGTTILTTVPIRSEDAKPVRTP